MNIKTFEIYSKIVFKPDEKLNKYFLETVNGCLTFNAGRAKEFSLRKIYGYNDLELENVPHTQAGDININGEEWNVKSYKCELKAKGDDLNEKVENYVKDDASVGMIYIAEINNKYYEIRMRWEKAKEFIKTFGRVEGKSGNIRIAKSDRKIYEWAIQQ